MQVLISKMPSNLKSEHGSASQGLKICKRLPSFLKIFSVGFNAKHSNIMQQLSGNVSRGCSKIPFSGEP